MPAIQRALAAGNPVVAISSDDKTQLDQGTLLTVDNTIDPTTGTIKLKAIFPNQLAALARPVRQSRRLETGVSKGVLTVPSVAVRHGQDELFVYVVRPDKQVVSRQIVEVERDDGVTAVIRQGIKEGQLAVTEGQSRLQNGTHVSFQYRSPKEAANPPQEGG